MRRLSELRDASGPWERIAQRVEELRGLMALAADEEDEALQRDLEREVEEISHQLGELEFRLSMGGEYADHDAILAIHAGAGGVDAQDWAEMLLRMYLRWAERRGFQTRILDTSAGEEAGLKSALVEVQGPYAYGYLKAEKGVHRLVRLSPFDAGHRRHTSFALVEVLPEIDEDVKVDIRPEDLKIETFRASSAGGQHVQKTSSAVRMTHLPSGIVVSCQNERSQAQNKATALKVLRARLLELQLKRRDEEQARLKGGRISAEWGNQIRSYILHPYTLVKDHRSGYERAQVEDVLNGEIDDFIETYLKNYRP